VELGNQVAGKLKDLEGNSYFYKYKSHVLEGNFDILEGKLDSGCREALHFFQHWEGPFSLVTKFPLLYLYRKKTSLLCLFPTVSFSLERRFLPKH